MGEAATKTRHTAVYLRYAKRYNIQYPAYLEKWLTGGYECCLCWENEGWSGYVDLYEFGNSIGYDPSSPPRLHFGIADNFHDLLISFYVAIRRAERLFRTAASAE